jgi:hypothetical protein
MTLTVKPFYLLRNEDVSGISGTGVIGVGVVFPNGRVVFQWCSYRSSLEIVDSVDNLMEIHSHGGKTELIYGNPPEANKTAKTIKKTKAY